MPKKAKGKSKARKSASRKPARKAVKKKVLKKKTAKKKTAKKKAVSKKKAQKKKVAKKTMKKKTAAKTKPARKQAVKAEPTMVKPGPPIVAVQPVEEPVQHEEAIGIVTHYYSHLNVAVVQLNKGTLKTGDAIHIKGITTDFTQQVESMEYEHQHIDQATAGQSFGLKVIDHVREHDIVYREK